MNNCGWVRNGGKCILEQENKKYKEVIDKAIEILKLKLCNSKCAKETIKILKGE